MSTPAGRKRRRLGLFVGLVAAFGAFLALGAGTASAGAALCGPNAAVPGQLDVTLASGASVTIAVGAGDFITVDGVSCGGTTGGPLPPAGTGVNVIVVYGTDAGNESVTIEQSAARFEPGATFAAEPPGLNEIEWIINLGEDNNTPPDGPPLGEDNDSLIINDWNAAGAVTIGEDTTGSFLLDTTPTPLVPATLLDATITAPVAGGTLVNLNAFVADNDADILDGGTLGDSIENITVNGQIGNDFLSAKGGDGTGSPIGSTPPGCLPVVIPPPTVGFDELVPTITLNGGAGDDSLQGGECGDTLIGGPGVDVIQGNGPSTPVGCFQNEILGQYEPLTGPGFGDLVDLSAEAGPLTIVFNADGSISITPAPADFVSGVEGVIGSAGNDTITGNANANFIGGGGGDDTLAGGLGDDCVVGGAGNDILDENAPLKADGTPDYGPTGNGADALDGGPGADDTVTYSARTNRTLVHLGVISWFNDGADPNANAITDECDDVFFTTENAITGSGNDILSADYLNNQSDNEFTGGAGNDQMEGGAGNDTFHEGSAANGADAMEGDAGADVADYSQRTNPVLVSLDGNSNDGEAGEGDNVGAGLFSSGRTGACALGFCVEDLILTRSIQGGPGGALDLCGFPGQSEPFSEAEAEDLVDAEVENVMGGSGNDTLVGDNASNVLTGNAGNDTLTGEGGSDRLVGGDGDDTLAGGAGNDELDGGAGTNTADFGSSASAVNVNLGTNTSNGEGNDTLAGIVNVNGSSHNDSINGDASANVLNGRGGSDTINGRGGDDTVNGGSGVDELNGNGGNDRVSGGSGNDAVRGQSGADNLQGGPGADFVGGAGGNDRLSGNAGNDFLNGGAGTDSCNVGAPGLGNGDQRINCP